MASVGEHNSEETTYVCCLCDDRVVSATGSRLNIWTAENHKSLLGTVDLPSAGEISCVRQSTIDNDLLAVSVSSSIMLYDLRNLKEPKGILQENTAEINDIGFHHTLRYVYACDDAGKIVVYSINDQKPSKTLSGHANLCTCAKFLPHEPWDLISGGMDCRIIRWNWIHSRAVAESSALDSEHNSSQNMFVNPPMVYCMDIWEDLKCIACGLGNGIIAVYDVKEKSMEFKCSSVLHSTMVVCICCCKMPDDHEYCLVSGGNNGVIVVSGFTSKELRRIRVIEHGSKINWICVDAGHIFVADQTSFVTKYYLQ